MRFCSSRAIFVFLGLLAFGSVHAMPLEGAPELDKRESLADSPVSNENGQPNFSSANALNGLTQVGRRGNTPDIDIRPLLSGREVVPRTTPKTNYVNSGQISTDGSCNGQYYAISFSFFA